MTSHHDKLAYGRLAKTSEEMTDAELLKMLAELNGEDDDRLEERSLKRFSLIQDYLAIENDLPDQAYIDALSEEIYSRMFEKN